MKPSPKVALLLAVLLTTGSALAQNRQTPAPVESGSAIDSARCAYAVTDPRCSTANPTSSERGPTTAVQFPRRAPGPPPLPPRPRSVRMANPAPGPVVRGIVIGGMIGFALGAFAPQQATGRTRFTLGMLVGLAGAGIGAAIAADHSSYRFHRQYDPWPDEDEAASRGNPVQGGSHESFTDPSGKATIAAQSGKDLPSPGTRTLIAASHEK